MIKIRIFGRTGNQLFQFAFAKLYARKFRTLFILDVNDQPLDLKYFDLPGYWGWLHSPIFHRIYNRIQKYFLKSSEVIDVSNCKEEINTNNFKDNSVYFGFFQDVRLVGQIKSDLIKWYKIKPKYKKSFETIYMPLMREKQNIVIHFRLGDYNGFEPFSKDGISPILPLSWYYKVLQRHDLSHYNVFCISDDIESVRKSFKLEGIEIHFIKADVPTDFLVLNNADICIISNSTFAWWAAYLNDKAQKVYCPKYFLGFLFEKEYPPSIYPQEWIQVAV